MTWSLYQRGKFLEPLKFSNGKNQEEVCDEVLRAIEKGSRVIFIHGVCGTGKSAIALNIAKELGKSSVVVPGKTLQEQYKRDYENEKYVLKKNGEKLKISVMTGRKNHKCKFLEDNEGAIPKIKREIDSKLQDIFEGKLAEAKELIAGEKSADNINLPCKIEIKEKNWSRIKEYLKKNKNVNFKDIEEISDVTRTSVAGVCPYWSPVLPEKYELKSFPDSKKKTYLGLNNLKFNFCSGKPGCGFYEQFNSYIDSDVIVFNSLKYKLESLLNRKPLTEVEIIDECDEFLDKFSNSRSINLDRLQNSLINASWRALDSGELIEEIGSLIQHFKRDEKVKKAEANEEILHVKETGIYDLINIILKNPELLENIDEESYIFDFEETARMFEDFLDETYLTVNKNNEQLIANLVSVNLAKKFKQLLDKNKVFVLMSGTLHSERVLKDIFGIEEFCVIDAETEQQGEIEVKKTGLEKDFRYSNFANFKTNRAEYLKALDKCIEIAKKPVLVHVNAFSDLPNEREKEELKIENIPSRESLFEEQKIDKKDKKVEKFKKGEIDILFSTKCSRGVDFPGEQCNSIIFTKYPNPNVQDAFWKILNKTKPQYYWEFYKDKASRELWQKVYRGLRFKEDHVFVLSPDLRVIEAFERNRNL